MGPVIVPGDPVPDERIHVPWQVGDRRRTPRLRKLPELQEDRHARDHRPRRVVVLREPRDIPLDRLAKPGVSNAVNRGGTNEEALKHGG